MTLIAYEEPETCPVGYLLSNDYAESVGLKLNSAILGNLKIITNMKLKHEYINININIYLI